MALRALGPINGYNYDSDDECPPARLPFIKHHLQPPPCVVGEPRFVSKNDAWNVRIDFQLTLVFCCWFIVVGISYFSHLVLFVPAQTNK